MKMNLGGLLLGIVVLVAGLDGCKKDNASIIDTKGYMNNAEILGRDPSSIACAPTFLLKFETRLNYYGDTVYGVINSGPQMGITGADTFPIYMRLDWSGAGSCDYPKIEVTQFQRR